MRIPERTVDSMAAIEICRLEPTSIISSPANSLGAVDHLVRHQFVVTILECKGVDARDRIPVDLHQLTEYAYGRGPRETIYLLPSRPDGDPPWQRRCPSPCCNGVGCRYCPRDARSWTGLESWVRRLSRDDQLQPWFGHWAWCVPAVDLAPSLGATGPASGGTIHLQWEDAVLGPLPNAVRLCHLFGRPLGGLAVSRAASGAAQASEPDALADLNEARDGREGTPPLVILQPTER